MGKMWESLRSRCQSFFHTDPHVCRRDSVLELSLPDTHTHTPAGSCVADVPPLLQISVDKEGDGSPRALLLRRDSYSRHAPWGKKKHSSSTKTQSSLEARARTRGRRERRLGVSCMQEISDASSGRGASVSGRSLRQRLRETVSLCLPMPALRRGQPAGSSCKRKIHLTELMLETCPFPAGSDLASKWHLIKQHTAPVSPHASALLDAFDPAHAPAEDEEERLRERRRLSIEEGVDPPPNARIHTLEASPRVTGLYKCGPKMAAGDAAGDSSANASSPSVSGISAQVSSSISPQASECDSEEDSLTLCLQSRRPKQRHASGEAHGSRTSGPWKVHTQIDYIHCLVPDLQAVAALPCYWGVMDRYQAEALLEGKPEGTFLLRDSAQEDYLFSVSFRRYNRSLHARIEQWNHNFSFDAHDPCVFHSSTVTGLLEHYKDPSACMFFEPLLTVPLNRTFAFSLQQLARAAICRNSSYDGIGALPLPAALQGFLKEYHYKQKVRVRWLEREPPFRLK